jgi:FecR protein
MSDSEKMSPSVIALVDELLDGRITDENLRKLDDVLRHNAAAQRFLLSYSQLHLDLVLDSKAEQAFQSFRDRQQQQKADLPVQLHRSKLAPSAGPFGGFGWQGFRGVSSFGLGAFVLLLLALVVASVSFFSTRTGKDFHSTASTESARLPSLTRIQLEAGVARLRLDEIGSVVIEGPADFRMIGPKRARLDAGRIRVRVCEETGKGFTIETPDGEVVDLGTEFGLDVSNKQKTGLVVFQGAVDLKIKDDPSAKGGASSQRLVQGDAINFMKGSGGTRVMSVLTGGVPTFRQIDDLPTGESAPLILNVVDNLRSPDAKNFYEIRPKGLHEHALAYADRAEYEWTGLASGGAGAFLNGADYIKPFNGDKLQNDLRITVTLSRPAKLFVLFDRRLPVPDWLKSDFTDTGSKITMNEHTENPQREFSIWERIVPKPGQVTLGRCQENGEIYVSMYCIAAMPLALGSAQ